MCEELLLDATQDEEGEGPGGAPLSHSAPGARRAPLGPSSTALQGSVGSRAPSLSPTQGLALRGQEWRRGWPVFLLSWPQPPNAMCL